MTTPVPPTIQASGQFNDLFVKTLNLNGMANGYITNKGGAVTIDGAGSKTYTASNVASSVIIRTGLDDDTTDTLPSVATLMNELGLSTQPGNSYVRYFTVCNNTSHNLTIEGDSWSFTGPSVLGGYDVRTYVLTISLEEGWTVNALIISTFNLD
jgi:hypothetical protein